MRSVASYYINPQVPPIGFPKATAPTAFQLHLPEVALEPECLGRTFANHQLWVEGEVFMDTQICKDPGYRQEAEQESQKRC